MNSNLSPWRPRGRSFCINSADLRSTLNNLRKHWNFNFSFFLKNHISHLKPNCLISQQRSREGAGGAMMLNSLKLTVSFEFFPVGKEIQFLQKTAGLRGRMSNYQVLPWRQRDGNLHVVYSHTTRHADPRTFWKSAEPRLDFGCHSYRSKRPSRERELPGERHRVQLPLPPWAPWGFQGNPSSPQAGVPGPRAARRKAIPTKCPRQPEPHHWNRTIKMLINLHQVARLGNAIGTY